MSRHPGEPPKSPFVCTCITGPDGTVVKDPFCVKCK